MLSAVQRCRDDLRGAFLCLLQQEVDQGDIIDAEPNPTVYHPSLASFRKLPCADEETKSGPDDRDVGLQFGGKPHHSVNRIRTSYVCGLYRLHDRSFLSQL